MSPLVTLITVLRHRPARHARAHRVRALVGGPVSANVEAKYLEIRDEGTRIEALALKFGTLDEAERWIVATGGWGRFAETSNGTWFSSTSVVASVTPTATPSSGEARTAATPPCSGRTTLCAT